MHYSALARGRDWRAIRTELTRNREAIVFVQQPCTHPVQLHGMCGVCGKELAEYVSQCCFAVLMSHPYAKLGHAESRRTDYLARPIEPSEAGPSRFPGSYEMGHDSLGVTVSHAVSISIFSLFSLLHFTFFS